MKAVVGLTLLTVALVVVAFSGPTDASFNAKDVLNMMSLASPMGIWSALRGNAEDAASQPTFVLVQTDLGVLRGTLQNNYVRFAGIPYAKPPTGSLRWQRPVAAPGWGNTVRNATLFAPACPQFGYNDTAGMDEDCLYLNIWAPATLFTNPGPNGIIDLRNSSTTFPVFFWIHGGAFLDGKGSDPTFSGDYWANTTNTVVVTINYRLGPFGFLNAAGSQFEGNYGIRDQQLALQWAQQNIRAFSGDPKRVTIAGESAGGMSITLHVVLPGSFNAYRAAITQSNPVSLLYRTPEEDLPYAQKFASQLNCTSISNVTCLYSLPWQTIWESEDLKDWIINFPINTKEVLPWAPTVDGSYLTDQPLYLIQRGEFNREAVQVFGTVKNETQTFIPDVVFPPFLYNSFLGSLFGPQNATLVEQRYPATGLNCRTSLVNALSDYIFVCPTRAASLAISQFNVPSYNYHFLFNGTNPAYEPAICKNAVCHAAELPYEFYSAEFIGRKWTPQTKDMSIRMIEYWAQIVHSKLPGIRVLSKNADPVWPLYNKASNQSLVLNVPVSTVKNYNFDNCNFWDSLGYTF